MATGLSVTPGRKNLTGIGLGIFVFVLEELR